MAHRERLEVVFADVDMMGHVNNATYFTYFETARTNYLLRLNASREPFSATDLDFIVARASCDYKRGLRWGERVEIVVWPSRLGETSFTFEYALLDAEGKVAARGETVQVSFDYSRQAKKAIPPGLRRTLEAEQKAGSGLALPARGEAT